MPDEVGNRRLAAISRPSNDRESVADRLAPQVGPRLVAVQCKLHNAHRKNPSSQRVTDLPTVSRRSGHETGPHATVLKCPLKIADAVASNNAGECVTAVHASSIKPERSLSLIDANSDWQNKQNQKCRIIRSSMTLQERICRPSFREPCGRKACANTFSVALAAHGVALAILTRCRQALRPIHGLVGGREHIVGGGKVSMAIDHADAG